MATAKNRKFGSGPLAARVDAPCHSRPLDAAPPSAIAADAGGLNTPVARAPVGIVAQEILVRAAKNLHR